MDVADWVRFGVGIVVLTALAVALAAWARVAVGRALVTALLRATVQLTVVALLLRGVLAAPWTVVGFLALMLATATLTAGGRTRALWHGRRAAALGITLGATLAVGVILALRLVPLDARYVVAVSGIVVGGAMSGATLAGRHFLRTAGDRADEVEGWLALGATPPRAHDEIGRHAVREAMLPGIDQTRSTGLVTLPGAFVGALFGGASPAEAARFQLVVLAGLALALLVAAVVVVRVAGRSPFVVAARR